MLKPSVPPQRRQFARRLRDFRIDRGFKTARSLARALGIDENRYTRYERAEVEPDLSLIHRICETLSLTPDDLFGWPEPVGTRADSPPAGGVSSAGFSEAGGAASLPTLADRGPHRDAVAWSLACAVAELQADPHSQDADTRPLATLQGAARIFADLERRPFAAVSEILLLPDVAKASPAQARRISELVANFAKACV